MKKYMKQVVLMIGSSIATICCLFAQNEQNTSSPSFNDMAANHVDCKDIRVEELPQPVRDSVNKVAPKTIWRSAVIMSRKDGDFRSWYVLTGFEEVKVPVKKSLPDGKTGRMESVTETIQVRVTSNGERVLDVGRQIDFEKVPTAVKRAFKRAASGKNATAMLEVRSTDGKQLLGYGAIVNSGFRCVTYHIAVDGSGVNSRP